MSLQRRFRNGISFGANDTIGLSTVGSTAARLQHNPDGTVTNRPDQDIARTIRLGKSRTLQLRVDMFNMPNSAGITGRNTTLVMSSPADPITNVAPVFDPTTGLLNDGVNKLPNGQTSPDRSKPKNAGFGVASGYQTPRNIQLQIRFSF